MNDRKALDRQRSYADAWEHALEHFKKQARAHGTCTCAGCQRAGDILGKIAQSPPCPACHGAGCAQCDWSGWK